jgi:hypothetical protein
MPPNGSIVGWGWAINLACPWLSEHPLDRAHSVCFGVGFCQERRYGA